jgi:integrase/recombinase XerD
MLYTKILDREWDIKKTPRPRKEKYLPTVLSQAQIKKLVDSGTMLKHQTFMLLLYATGLRLSEALNLKLENINTERLQVHVRKGKGHKDRYVILPKSFVTVLEIYLNHYNPKEYLFNGKYRMSRWSNRAAQECINMAIRKGDLPRSVSAHTLRHSYATHHLEKGTDLFTLQKQMGHKHLKTTARYVHLCTKHFRQIKHPINDLCVHLKNINSEIYLGNTENPS